MLLLRRVCCVALFAAVFASLVCAQPLPDSQSVLRSARERIRATWANEAEREEAYVAVRELVAGLADPGSHFLTPAEARAYRTPEATSFSGIGAVVQMDTDAAGGEPRVVISSLLPGGPAAQSALRPGDALLQIDDTPLAGRDLAAVVKLIRGESGSPVTLTVSRQGTPEPLVMRLVRAGVTVRTVEWRWLDPERKLGYVWVRALQPGTVGEVRAALGELQQQGLRGLLLDLSMNSGGSEGPGLEVAALLTAQSPVAWKALFGQEAQPLVAGGTPVLGSDVPLAILVDGGTAGLAEVLAGSLQDGKRAAVLGQRTAGAGYLREPFELADGSALVLPTGRYLTADRRDPSAADATGLRGLAPNVAFAAPDPQADLRFKQWHDSQIERAQLELQKLSAAR